MEEESKTGNLSKAKREKLIVELGAIKAFLEKHAGTDKNATRLLSFAADLEKEVREKKFGLVFEEHRERVDAELAENIPVLEEVKERFVGLRGDAETRRPNFLIEGDNLAALKLLDKTHRGRIDLIYIDPPYNTGNDDFMYNDAYVDDDDGFKHSKWLSFMEKRLRLAWGLLSREGAIFISIDDNEFAHLKMLCDSIFDESNFVNAIVVKMSEVSGVKMSHTTKRFAKLKEYCLIYCRDVNTFCLKPIIKMKTDDREKFANYAKYYSKIIVEKSKPVEEWEILPLEEYCSQHGIDLGDDKSKILAFKLDHADQMVYRTNNKAFSKIRSSKKLMRVKSARGLDYVWWEGKQMLFLSDYVKSFEGDLWTDISTINLNKEGFVDFPNGKKPLKLLQRILKTKPTLDLTVLDFFAGSGTTGHAVMKLNAEDNGHRQFILVTNNENGICEKVTYKRLKRVIAKENYAECVKYFRVGYMPILEEEGYWERADSLLKHVRELVELENGIDFAHDKSVAIVLTDGELATFVQSLSAKDADGPRILYKGHNVLVGTKAKAALDRRHVEVRTIPDYYYPELED